MVKKRDKVTPKKGVKLISKAKAAERLDVHKRTIDRMIKAGTLSHTMPQGKVLVPESEIDEMIDANWVQRKAWNE